MTKRIPVGKKGFHAIVDDEDFELVSQYKWNILKTNTEVYAIAVVGSWKGDSKRTPKRILMHQLITGWNQTDHINNDGLDNRRENLRDGSGSVNTANATKTKLPRTSKFKGVTWHKKSGKWLAQAGGNYLGLFQGEVQAALAYDAKARELWGEASCVNFPEEGERGCL